MAASLALHLLRVRAGLTLCASTVQVSEGGSWLCWRLLDLGAFAARVMAPRMRRRSVVDGGRERLNESAAWAAGGGQ